MSVYTPDTISGTRVLAVALGGLVLATAFGHAASAQIFTNTRSVGGISIFRWESKALSSVDS